MTQHLSTTPRAESAPAELRQPRVFNSTDRVPEGWYWALPSKELGRGKVVPLELMGRSLVAWRGQDGVAHVMDAHCPHMGAHLAEGKVDGNGLRCFFHAWKFDAEGDVVDVPCLKKPVKASVPTWPTGEKYGVIWVWTGTTPRHPLPYIPEIGETTAVDAQVASRFEKGCHPNVMMVNAIDEQHFKSVHHLPADLHFEVDALNDNCIRFDNATRLPEKRLWMRLAARFYAEALTYRMVYWNGSTGSVTVGPDFWHFHIVFALRPTADGRTEGLTLPVTPARPGPLGWVLNRIALFLSSLVGAYFAVGDTRVFQTMRWNFATPIAPDRPIVQFIRHLEAQPTVRWGTWDAEDLEPMREV